MTTIGNIFPDYPRVTDNKSKATVKQPPVKEPRDSVNHKWTWDPEIDRMDLIGRFVGYAGGICGFVGGVVAGGVAGGYLGSSLGSAGTVIGLHVGALLGGVAGFKLGFIVDRLLYNNSR